MQKMSEPSTPVEAYKAIIDALATTTTSSLSARLIREEGIFTKARGFDVLNEVIRSLPAESRDSIARMLEEEAIRHP